MAIILSLIKYILYLKELKEPSGYLEKSIPGRKSSLYKGLHREVHVCHVLRITWKAVCLCKGESKGEMIDIVGEIIGSQILVRIE